MIVQDEKTGIRFETELEPLWLCLGQITYETEPPTVLEKSGDIRIKPERVLYNEFGLPVAAVFPDFVFNWICLTIAEREVARAKAAEDTKNG